MADFGKGDRIVKMSGVAAGRYGTVNGVRDDGTLNVTFDGERLPRYCDPMRCGKVAANATKSRLKGFKVGDKVKDRHGNVGIVEKIQTDDAGPFGPPPNKYGDLLGIKDDDGRIGWLNETNAVLANFRACNATGDQVIATSGKYRLVYNPLNEGYWFYVGDYGEGMSDVNGRSIFGKDKKSVAMAEFKRLVATANSRACNAFADEATARRDIEQSLRKMADFAAGFTGAKASATPTHGDYHLAGYIDLKFPDGDKADAFNPYYLINELNGNKSVLPKWAWGVGGFSYERRGSAWRINVGRFST